MTKKSKTNNLITKSNVTLVASLTALVLSIATALWLALFWDSYLLTMESNGDQVYDLYIKSAQHDICIENSIKHCNREEINKFFEAQN